MQRLQPKITSGDVQGVKILLEADSSCVWEEDERGWTTAHCAVSRSHIFKSCYPLKSFKQVYLGHLGIVQLLFRAESSLFSKPNRLGDTAVHKAAKQEHLHILRWLWNQDSELFLLQDRHGKTPLEIVKQKMKIESTQEVPSVLRGDLCNPKSVEKSRKPAKPPVPLSSGQSVEGHLPAEGTCCSPPCSAAQLDKEQAEKKLGNPEQQASGPSEAGRQTASENDTGDTEFVELCEALATAFGPEAKDDMLVAWGLDASVEKYAEIPHPTSNGLPMHYESLAGRDRLAMDQFLAGNRRGDVDCMELAVTAFDDPEHVWPHAPVYVALAFAQSEMDGEMVRDNLRKYAAAMSARKEWDPVMLLAAARASPTQGWGTSVVYLLLALYFSLFGPQAKKLMTEQDWKALRAATQARPSKHVSAVNEVQSPSEMWQLLKKSLSGHFPTMDELMGLTGLHQVKLQALGILRKIESDKLLSARQRAPRSLNFTFMGNPGTGKTMVARLFAKILHETGARSSAVMEETTGQKLVQDGAIKADAVIQSAVNGVLFIDEAHSLDPKHNRSEGPAIMTKLLKAAEDQREHLTIILAGYQDEIEDRLYASDPGFQSRFEDIVFPDYSEEELRALFLALVLSKEWVLDPATPRLAQVVAARMARGRGSKGFANARTVRSMVEKGIERASLASRAPILKVQDFIGERPDVHHIPELRAALEELETMTGLKTEYNEDGSKRKRAVGIPPKEAIHQLVQTVQGNYDKEVRGEQPLQVALNRLFLGNPGTGKTTVAQLYGRILRLLNLLSNGSVVLKQPGDFITGHEGGTEQSTLAILKNATGKVLVIDEAYVFNQSNYGKIAVDMIVSKVMGNPGEDIAVLMLGYEEPMLKMIRDQNPGLKRRFQPADAFFFADFDDQELLQILKHRLESEALRMDRRVRAQAIRLLGAERNKPHFGNAGSVNNLLSRAKTRMSARDLRTRTILADDLGLTAEEAGAGGDPFKDLESMYKTESVIEELRELQASIRFEQHRGGRVEVPNYIFVGNPGTGKTRVANIMASMLGKLGVLESKTKVTTAQEIQGQYVGQTTARARELIEDAQGGILFVDEAHNLANSPYSIEAAKTLMTATLEDAHKGKTMLIFAGYKQPMDDMMRAVDPGMRRRFKGVIEFPDWSAEDCVGYLGRLCQSDGVRVDEAAREHVLQALRELRRRPGWGNASDAVDTHERLGKAMVCRLQDDPASPRDRIVLQDAVKAMDKFLKLRPAAALPTSSMAGMGVHIALGVAGQALAPGLKPTPKIEQVKETNEPATEVEAKAEDGGGDHDVFSSLQLACVELGYDHDQESRQTLIDILTGVQRGWGFPEDILEHVQAKTGQTADSISAALRPQVPRLAASMQEAYRSEQARLAALRRLEEEQREVEAEAARREHQRKQQRLRTMGRCPAGFGWYKWGSGWRCHGGTHFVDDASL